jgi:putative addiction module component (TIGR02574 family)
MTPNLHDLGIDQLSVDARIELAQAIWDSIPVNSEPQPLSQSLREELDRRLADDEKNPDAVIPWEKVKADISARLDR